MTWCRSFPWAFVAAQSRDQIDDHKRQLSEAQTELAAAREHEQQLQTQLVTGPQPTVARWGHRLGILGGFVLCCQLSDLLYR
jgi:hypothetical protein